MEKFLRELEKELVRYNRTPEEASALVEEWGPQAFDVCKNMPNAVTSAAFQVEIFTGRTRRVRDTIDNILNLLDGQRFVVTLPSGQSWPDRLKDRGFGKVFEFGGNIVVEAEIRGLSFNPRMSDFDFSHPGELTVTVHCGQTYEFKYEVP